ncbi:phage minor head protein [Phaeobacter sp. 11ANDIMAR09]|uniref:phage head morphogenesis protein n=1 Tax=Phaeobacter sp. 11ANDIMAR09 TaxID=1225647 RepID=UPI0006C8A309|nr:phage minor head protein [Phaeobacter sp. 11ANDIMAR09]KPD10873.1 virion morphogenesis protein [Phaeobacter sp. 11ANDIMAR09]
MADAFGAIFRKPFAEQLAAFRLRLGDLVPTSAWDDLLHSAHDRAFMVAGATKADLLQDLASAVDKAISEGTGLEAFKRDFRAIVEKHGWHGWTGEGTPKGEAWRMRTIYRTNMRTSYMAGRLAQLRDGGFPLWVYRHGGSADPRPQHLAWDGLILEADHPFWETHYPPNEWGCSCRVFGARSLNAALRRGGKADVKLAPNWDKPDPKTGNPPGVGRGWAYAPGDTVSETVLQLRDKLETLNARPSSDLIQSWITGGPFETWLKDPKGSFPLVRLRPEDAQAIGSKRLVADISSETIAKLLREQPGLTATDFAVAQEAINYAAHRIQHGSHSLIFRQVTKDGKNLLTLKVTQTEKGLLVTEFRREAAAKATAADPIL